MIATQEQAAAEQLKLRSLLETIVSAIGRRTVAPEIEHVPDKALFNLKVDPYDQGLFVGKLGETIWAIKTIFWYAGLTLFGWSYSIELYDHPKDENRKLIPFKYTRNWPRKKIENLVSTILETCLRSFQSHSLTEVNEVNLTVNLKLMQYLKINLSNPDFVEAFSTIMRVAGMSNGVHIKTEATWQ